MKRTERVLMQIFDLKIQSFYNEQLKRDEYVLTFLDKREEKMEGSMMQKVICCRRQRSSSISTRNDSRNLGGLWRRG